MADKKPCTSINVTGSDGTFSAAVKGNCNAASGNTVSSISDLTLKEINDYLSNIENTATFIENNWCNKEITQDIMTIVNKFALVQDSIYHRKNLTTPDSHLADDLLEILITTKDGALNDFNFNFTDVNDYGDYGKNDEKRNKLMHDIWMLGKMFVIEENKLVRKPNDGGKELSIIGTQNITNETFYTNENVVINVTVENFDTLKDNFKTASNNKNILVFEIDNKKYAFQARRVFGDKQVRPFENLTDDQKRLDEPSQFTFIATITEEYKKLIDKFLDTLKPVSGGRKPKPTKPSKTYPIKTKRTVMINGKPRTIFEGKRGGEYVKKGDGFVKVAEAIRATKSKK